MAGTQTFPTVPSTGGTSTSAEYMLGAFGDGSDGNFTYVTSGTPYTIAREWNYADLTIQAGATVKPAGFRMFVRGTLSNAGSFNDDGLSATGATQGAGLAARQFLGAQSGAGGAGRNTTGVGTGGSAISSSSYGSLGVMPTGGAGGQADGANLGGTAGGATPGSARWASLLVYGRGATAVNGGSGGGAGGCNVGTGTATSGGGGGGAGDVYIAARYITNTGTISAIGGKGGDAVATGDGKAGGGGGGGGGHVGIVTMTPSTSIGGVVSAAGGVGGAAAGAGSPGSGGTAGSVSYLILA